MVWLTPGESSLTTTTSRPLTTFRTCSSTHSASAGAVRAKLMLPVSSAASGSCEPHASERGASVDATAAARRNERTGANENEALVIGYSSSITRAARAAAREDEQ